MFGRLRRNKEILLMGEPMYSSAGECWQITCTSPCSSQEPSPFFEGTEFGLVFFSARSLWQRFWQPCRSGSGSIVTIEAFYLSEPIL